MKLAATVWEVLLSAARWINASAASLTYPRLVSNYSARFHRIFLRFRVVVEKLYFPLRKVTDR